MKKQHALWKVIESTLRRDGVAYYTFNETDGLIICPEYKGDCSMHDGSKRAWLAFEACLVLHLFSLGIDYDIQIVLSSEIKRQQPLEQDKSRHPAEPKSSVKKTMSKHKTFELCALNGKVISVYSYNKITSLYPRDRKHIRKLQAQPDGFVIVQHGDIRYMIRHRGSTVLPTMLKKAQREPKSVSPFRSSDVPSARNATRRRLSFLPTSVLRQR